MSEGFPVDARGKNPHANAGDIRDAGLIRGSGGFPGGGNGKPLYPVFLPGEFPWTEEPMGLQRVRHDWGDLAHTDEWCSIALGLPELLWDFPRSLMKCVRTMFQTMKREALIYGVHWPLMAPWVVHVWVPNRYGFQRSPEQRSRDKRFKAQKWASVRQWKQSRARLLPSD